MQPIQLTREQLLSGSKGNVDLQNGLLAIHALLETVANAVGVAYPSPVNQSQGSSSAAPGQPGLSVTGANGAFTVTLTPPTQSVNTKLYYQVSYSPDSNFQNGVTTMPSTTATSLTVASPGQSLFFRARCSTDQRTWSVFTFFSGAVSSGLISSAASANNVPLNQTNYATIDSSDNATGSANVRVFGTAGLGFSYPSVKGSEERILPSATIVGVPLSSKQVVAYDGSRYRVRPTMPQVFADELIPVGSVSVVGGGAVELPVVSLIVIDGHVLAWNVVSPGNGITASVNLTINTSSGSGATAGVQTIEGGKLISVAPGNPGIGYSSGDTVTVSGGTFAGAAGGGQAIGGNNGRLIWRDGTTE